MAALPAQFVRALSMTETDVSQVNHVRQGRFPEVLFRSWNLKTYKYLNMRFHWQAVIYLPAKHFPFAQ